MDGRNRFIRLGLLLAILAGGWQGVRWWTSPERQIRQIAAAVAQALSHEQADSGLSAAAAVAALQDHLAPDVRVEWRRDEAGLTGRQQVLSAAVRVRASTPYLCVRFFDLRIAYTSETSALVHATLEVTMRGEAAEDLADARQLEGTVVVREGRWVVAAVRAVERAERTA